MNDNNFNIKRKKYEFIHYFMIDSPIFNRAIEDIIKMLNEEEKHLFVYRFKNSYDKSNKTENVIYDPSIGKAENINKYMNDHSFIIMHSLCYSGKEYKKIDKNTAKRMIWCVWGSDLYYLKKNVVHFILRKIYRFITRSESNRKKIIKNLKGITIGFSGDEIELRKKYGDNVPIYYALYPSGYFIDDVEKVEWSKEPNSKTRILIGHSSYRYLQHKKYINKLSKYKGKIELHIPLSYGDSEYAKEIEVYAENIFGDNDVYIYNKLMNSEEYIKLLKSIDVAIFDFKQQAAFGNIILLLYLRKKIYLSKKGVMYRGLINENCIVYDCNEIGNVEFNEFTYTENYNNNYKYAKNLLDLDYIKDQWNMLFNFLRNEMDNNE